MVIDISNTISLWQLIISVAIFLLTLIAFILAYTQWQKDNFLSVGKAIIALDRQYTIDARALITNAPNLSKKEIDSRRKDIVIGFLNELDMYAYYFLKGTYNPSLDEYFMGIFLVHWQKPAIRQLIQKARISKTSAYTSLERLAKKIDSKNKEDLHA